MANQHGTSQQLTAPLLPGKKREHLPLAPLYGVSLIRTTAFAVAMVPAFNLRVAALAELAGHDAAAAASLMGLITALRSLAEFVAAPLLAVWSDRAGRRRVLLASGLAFVMECALLAISQSLLVLGAVHAACGILASGGAVETSCIADATPAGPRRAVAVGRFFTVIGFALVIGPALGGALLARYGSSAPFAFAGVLAGIGLIATAFLLPEYLPASSRAQAKRRDSDSHASSSLLALLQRTPPLRWLVAASALCGLGQALFGTTNVLWMKAAFGWDGQDVGRFFAALGVGVILSQVFVLPWLLNAAKGRESLVLQVALLSNAFKFVGYSLAPSGGWLYAVLCISVPTFCAGPVLSSLCTRHVPATQQGLWSGSMSALNTAANVLGALVGSRLFAVALRGFLPLGAPLVAGAACYALATVCVAHASHLGHADAKKCEDSKLIDPEMPDDNISGA